MTAAEVVLWLFATGDALQGDEASARRRTALLRTCTDPLGLAILADPIGWTCANPEMVVRAVDACRALALPIPPVLARLLTIVDEKLTEER